MRFLADGTYAELLRSARASPSRQQSDSTQATRVLRGCSAPTRSVVELSRIPVRTCGSIQTTFRFLTAPTVVSAMRTRTFLKDRERKQQTCPREKCST